MHFGTKSYLKSNRNHTAKQTLGSMYVFDRFGDVHIAGKDKIAKRKNEMQLFL
jgi:hypothetical protein